MAGAFQVRGFRTVLGRRMALLFVLAALVPTTLVAFDAYRRIDRQLTAQAARQSRGITGSAAMAVLDRLQLAEAELELVARLSTVARDGDRPLDALPDFHVLRDLVMIEGDGGVRALRGSASAVVSAIAPGASGSGGTDGFGDDGWRLAVAEVPERGGTDVYLGRRTLDGRTLWARLDPDTLVSAARLHADVPGALGICLVASGLGPIACDAPIDPAAMAPRLTRSVTDRRTGELDYETVDGDPVWVGFIQLFLNGRYGVEPWIMATVMDRDVLLAQAEDFRWLFPRVLLVALAVVLLVSNDQIRRSLRPLEGLAAAARRIGAGDLGARVAVRSRDEFGAVGRGFNTMARQLGRQFRSLDALGRIARSALADPTRGTIWEAVLTHAAEAVPADAAALWLPEQGGGGTLYSAVDVGTGLGSGTASDHVRGDPVAESDEALAVSDEPPQWAAGTGAFQMGGFQRFLTLRLGADELQGLIVLASRSADAFPPELHATALQLAHQVTLALSTAELVERLEEAHIGALAALGRSVDLVSPWAAGHAERVAAVSVAMGQALDLATADVDRLHRAALLHDIGKIGVPHGILQRSGALRPHEEEQLRAHVRLGARILEPVAAFADITPIVEQHHERWDGRGYPDGLVGDAIHPLAQVLAVADRFDTLTSDAPDREGLDALDALRRIRQEAGTMFDPRAVEALRAVLRFQGPSEPAVNTDSAVPRRDAAQPAPASAPAGEYA